jgi:nicotinamide-nucleotide amidase
MDPFNHDTASQLHDLLRKHRQQIVFAESCTAGLISASLGRIPGISECLAGSAVVYQIETKAEWLGVDREALVGPGPVSQIVSEQMARGVLQMTPQATISASVTGHLGPNATEEQDGIAWSSVAMRVAGEVIVSSRQLKLDDGITGEDSTERRQTRQIVAVQLVLQFCLDQLQK